MRISPRLLLALHLLLTPIPAAAQVCVATEPSPCVGLLVISELTFNGPGGASDEFVEIYNRGATAVDASAVEIAYASAGGTTLNTRATLPAGTIIPPRSFYLATNASYSGSVTADLVGWSIGFSSSGGAVALRSGSTVLDLVGWGSPLLFESSPIGVLHSAGGSFERKAKNASTSSTMAPAGSDHLAGNGWDSDVNALDFVVQGISDPQNLASDPEPIVDATVPTLSVVLRITVAGLLAGAGFLAARPSFRSAPRSGERESMRRGR